MSEHRVAVVCLYEPSTTETFIRAHIDRLPAAVLITGWRPMIGGRTVFTFTTRARYRLRRMTLGETLAKEVTDAYVSAFRQHQVTAVLAEYGPCGPLLVDACRTAGIPLTVHFHGYDASQKASVETHRHAYSALFAAGAHAVVVSDPMREAVLSFGARPPQIHVNPYGVDVNEFTAADPAAQGPTVLAVGRFTDKKAPHVTVRAFAAAARAIPGATLRMIGDGPLLERCRSLATELGVADRVVFLGSQPPAVVRRELHAARLFAQHSVTAPDGDSEGSPVAITEAAACGLPVVATRHAGIPALVTHGESGWLVDEHDVDHMTAALARLLADTAAVRRMGEAARAHILAHFNLVDRIDRLRRIVTREI
jgi:colanic acid/amylovoran biosynthesis glycosyltransferase